MKTNLTNPNIGKKLITVLYFIYIYFTVKMGWYLCSGSVQGSY